MIHKHSNNSVINMVNYMANSHRSPYEFYSFCKISDDLNYWGLLVDGEYYCALMLSREYLPYQMSDEAEKELAQIEQGLVYAVMLHGTDNTSYIKRFKTKADMDKWALNVESIVLDETYLYYNS